MNRRYWELRRCRGGDWRCRHASVGDKEIKGLGREHLLVDLVNAAPALQFLHHFLKAHLVTLGHGGDTAEEFFLGHAESFLLSNAHENEGSLEPFSSILSGTGNNVLLVFLENLLR